MSGRHFSLLFGLVCAMSYAFVTFFPSVAQTPYQRAMLEEARRGYESTSVEEKRSVVTEQIVLPSEKPIPELVNLATTSTSTLDPVNTIEP